jgi:MFS transporter, DHA2 family, multidrug resistance protein
METWWSASDTSGKAVNPVANLGGEESVKLDSRLRKITVLYMLAPMMAALDVSVVNVAQRTFVHEFSSTQAIVAWTMTAFTLSLVAVVPLTGWAANRFGTKRLMLGSVLLFSLGSLLCATATSMTMLVTFRALEGLGGGILLPLTLTIVTHEAGPGRLARALAIGSVPMFIAPVCGPILGGWLIDSFGWQWIFLINVPIGLFTLALAGLVLPKDEPAQAESLDVVGMLLLTPGLVTLLYGVSLIPGRGTVDDPHVYVPAAVGSTLIVVFVVHALYRARNPLIDLRLLRSPMVASANAPRFLFAAAFFGASLLLPGYFQQVLGKTPLESGVLLLPQTLAAAAVAPFVGQLTEKRSPREVVLAGLTLIVAGMGVFVYGISQHQVRLPVLLAGLAVFGIGSGCSMMPVAWTAVRALEAREIAHGSTLLNVNHNAAVAIGASLLSVLLTSMLNHSTDIKDLSQAYTAVFAVAAIVFATTFIPAWFLPQKQARNPN